MSKITRQDTNGVKPLLATGELGYDNYPAGGDAGRVYVGTGSANIAQAKKSEVDAAVATTNAHIGRVDNPHSVTKTQVGLSNVDNTSDLNKPISTATQTALNTTVKLTGNQTVAGIKTFSSNPISTDTQSTATNALTRKDYVDTKAPLNSPTFTGTATLPATTSIGTVSSTELGHLYGVTSDIQTQLNSKLGTTATAVAATKLATPRTINGVSFDGTANITVSDSTAVKLTGNQTVAGVKTFSSSPVVPTPTTNTQAANKAYVDDLVAIKTIATGTATFTATTNNIQLTGIGVGVEIGDVIQISGADDAKNNSEFTVEVITDNNNIIVNQAHASKGTSKNVATRVSDTGVTVKLLAKWYNAPIGLGQDWVDVTSSRALATNYTNNTKRLITISVLRNCSNGYDSALNINDGRVSQMAGDSSDIMTTYATACIGNIYSAEGEATIHTWKELR